LNENERKSRKDSGAVVITGASRGIGAATARLAAERGYAVAVNYSTGEAEAAEVVRSICQGGGGKAVAIRGDLGNESDIVQLFAKAVRELGPLCGLVNNAGVTGGFARVDAVTAEALERVFAVNVTGAILCAREAVKRMSTRHGGRADRL
jgi:NAD(P)-dependent dehydrogenase (short-subunit alcohol dehydrogenase family)